MVKMLFGLHHSGTPAMNLPDRKLLLSFIFMGLVTPALADGGAIDTSKLVFHEGSRYQVSYDETVSSDPISVNRVKKIEAGKVSWITIATTTTGTYSTDAMFSRNVQYPGISVERLPWPDGAHDTPRPRNHFSYWSGTSWTGMSVRSGNSFSYYSAQRR